MNNQPQNAQDIVIDLKLSMATLNTIVAALDELPHKLSRRVIDDISQQVQPQLQSMNKPNGPLSDKVMN